MAQGTKSSARLDAKKDRLREVGTLLESVNDDRDALYEERLDLWKKLIDAGVSREELAELAGTTPGMIKFALSADRKKRKESTPRSR